MTDEAPRDTRGIVVISCDVFRLYAQPNCVQPQPMQSTRAVGTERLTG